MTKREDVFGDENYIPVLDHGFVGLVDKMGDDSSIVQAARVSYGKGTKRLNEDRGLIRYLISHDHGTPVEMVSFKFHVKVPIFIARQALRHRTACISGDANLYFDLPNQIKNSEKNIKSLIKTGGSRMTIKEFHDKWHYGSLSRFSKFERFYKKFEKNLKNIEKDRFYKVSELSSITGLSDSSIRIKLREDRISYSKDKNNMYLIKGEAFLNFIEDSKNDFIEIKNCNKKHLQSMKLRMMDEETGQIKHTNVVDIWQSGVKDVYELELEDGNKIKTTIDHRYNTEEGWMRLEDAIGLELNKDKSVKRWHKQQNFRVNGVPCYQSRDWMHQMINMSLNDDQIGEMAGVPRHTVRKWREKLGIKRTKEQIYDVDNLITLHKDVHKLIHRNNLEQTLREWIREDKPLEKFLENFSDIRLKIDDEKRNIWKNNGTTKDKTKLFSGLSKIKNIKYIGQEMTYDLEVAGPYHNFVCNGVVVHNSVNEYSARYSILSEDFYIPEPENIKPQSKSNKQGRDGELTHEQKLKITSILEEDARRSYQNYQVLINEYDGNEDGSEVLDGVPKELYEDSEFEGLSRELARMNLPVNIYTEMYWKIDLRNLFNFIRLRSDSHAQWEIQQYSNTMYDLIKPHVPLACEAFQDYIVESKKLSRMDQNLLRDCKFSLLYFDELINNSEEKNFKSVAKSYEMSPREVRELYQYVKMMEEN